MINLLPSEEKRIIFWEKRQKLALILWFLLLFFVVSLTLILFMTKIYLQYQTERQRNSFKNIEGQGEQLEIEEFQEKIKIANQTFKKLSDFYKNEFYLSETIERVSQLLPESLYLNSFSANLFPAEEKEEKHINFSFSGFAPNREDLFKLRNNFKEEEKFSDVYFPPTNWTKPSDIDFSVNFNVVIDQ